MRERKSGKMKVLGFLLIVAGALGLVFRGTVYDGDSHKANLGALQVSVTGKHPVSIPVGVSAGAIAAGALLLLL